MGIYLDYAGVIHAHSTHSDGRKDVKEVALAASNAGCDYLILSDHDTLAALPLEGWYGSTLLLVGEEISVGSNQGHYLGMRLTSEVSPHQSPQATINDVAAQTGIGFITHPFSKEMRYIFNLTPVSWSDWQVTGFNGLEIWNYSQDWVENFSGPWTYLPGLLFPDSFIEGPLPKTLQKWDELLLLQKVTGIGSVDAHGYFYSYRSMFKTVRTHILTEGKLSHKPALLKENKQLIYHALEKGNCYFSYDTLSPARGFTYRASNGYRQAIMGDELSAGQGVALKASVPRKAHLRIIRNGRVVASADNTHTLQTTVYEPGAYRAEAYLPVFRWFRKTLRPWIYSNPIYLV